MTTEFAGGVRRTALNLLARREHGIAELAKKLSRRFGDCVEIENVLAPDGIVIFSSLLTNSFIDRPDVREQFKNWWYKDDPTHVSFFCNRVLSKMADMENYDIDIFDDKAFVLKRGQGKGF